MNNERYNQIVDEVYKHYKRITHYENEKNGNWGSGDTPLIAGVQHLTKLSFIRMCKIDSDFSKKWGLKIEERELSQWERVKLLQESWKNNGIGAGHEEVSTLWVEYNNLMTKYTIPAKIITVTYNNEKIEFYEI